MGLQQWIDIERLGEGGQGIVTLVKQRHPAEPLEEIVTSLKYLSGSMESNKRPPMMARLSKALTTFIEGDYVRGAKKELITPDAESRARLILEAQVYEGVSNPNLLKILDKSPAPGGDWIVTEYQPNGTLQSRLPKYRCDAVGALRAIRPLVSVLADMHSLKFVHRDFKPQNIFIGRQHQLVLGDAGLAFYMGDTARRTQTYESVGTQHYMPAWAYGRRLKSIEPTFDVFSVGKVIWAMVAGEPTCPLWYVREPDFDLLSRFPGHNEMVWLDVLFGECVVQLEEEMKIRDGAQLLSAIDIAIKAIELERVVPERVREGGPCRVCGLGSYTRGFNGSLQGEFLEGLTTFLCRECGHVEFFTAEPPKK